MHRHVVQYHTVIAILHLDDIIVIVSSRFITSVASCTRVKIVCSVLHWKSKLHVFYSCSEMTAKLLGTAVSSQFSPSSFGEVNSNGTHFLSEVFNDHTGEMKHPGSFHSFWSDAFKASNVGYILRAQNKPTDQFSMFLAACKFPQHFVYFNCASHEL